MLVYLRILKMVEMHFGWFEDVDVLRIMKMVEMHFGWFEDVGVFEDSEDGRNAFWMVRGC